MGDSKKVIIGDVDCTAAGKPLCEKYGVRGYPTIKYFNPPDEEGEDYKGGRCSAEQKKELETYIAIPADERAKMLEDMKSELSAAEAKHEALLKELQATYKESMDALEKLKESSAPKIKLLKAATPTPKADAPKDEM